MPGVSGTAVGDAVLYRGWWPDHASLFADVRQCFAYADGENRATSYLDGWPEIVDALEDLVGVRFTIVAFQAYRDGTAGCDWHADTPFDAQAILSLGTPRFFAIRKGNEEHKLLVAGGDLFYMPSGFQRSWLHSLPPDPQVDGERISLVFRTT